MELKFLRVNLQIEIQICENYRHSVTNIAPVNVKVFLHLGVIFVLRWRPPNTHSEHFSKKGDHYRLFSCFQDLWP